jgi:hypothetical protein
VDLCHGLSQVLHSGYYADSAEAAAGWRGMVGSSAAGVEPGPAGDEVLCDVLPGGGVLDGLFGEPVTDGGLAELFRADGVVAAVVGALAAAGRPVRWRTDTHRSAVGRVDGLVGRFRA